MKKVGFWLAKCAAYLIAITPFSLLYLKADIWCFLIYHLVRYRRKVVRDNLVKSFPEKPVQEIKRIEKRFYLKPLVSLYPECDAEAIRVVKKMPKWKPGKQMGKPVRCYFNLPIRFTLQ